MVTHLQGIYCRQIPLIFISTKGRRRSSSSLWNHLKQFKAVGTGVLGVPEFQNNSTYKLKGRISINFHSVRNFLNLESSIGGPPEHRLSATGDRGNIHSHPISQETLSNHCDWKSPPPTTGRPFDILHSPTDSGAPTMIK